MKFWLGQSQMQQPSVASKTGSLSQRAEYYEGTGTPGWSTPPHQSSVYPKRPTLLGTRGIRYLQPTRFLLRSRIPLYHSHSKYYWVYKVSLREKASHAKKRLCSVVVITPDFDCFKVFRQPRFEPGHDLSLFCFKFFFLLCCVLFCNPILRLRYLVKHGGRKDMRRTGAGC
jgi:hypothetical protein